MSTPLGDAFDAGLDSARAWLDGNIAAGGACDFCGTPLLHADAVTWKTEQPIKVMVAAFAEGEGHTAPIDYGIAWAACGPCDLFLTALQQRLPDEPKEAARQLAAYALAERRTPRHPDAQRVLDTMTAEERDEFDAGTRDNLVALYAATFERGLHRVGMEPETPPGVERASFRVVKDPGGRWVDAYEAQVEQWRWLRTDIGRAWWKGWVDLECKRAPIKKEIYGKLAASEPGRLRHVAPIYVTGDMCELIDAARKSFEPEAFLVGDVIVPHGFVYFARPFVIADRNGRRVNVKAISYQPIVSDRAGEPGIGICFYSSLRVDTEFDDDALEMRQRAREVSERFGIAVPELTPLLLTTVWFGHSIAGEEVDVDDGDQTGVRQWWTLLQVTFRLMAQRVAEPTERQLDRHARKRAARAGHDARNVIVVHLRRARAPRHGDEEAGGQREYSHRWLVDGHWRAQWYPSVNAHRQLWIAPYAKGPEGKPLVVKQKVYEWDR